MQLEHPALAWTYVNFRNLYLNRKDDDKSQEFYVRR